jgi:hypothetical protein
MKELAPVMVVEMEVVMVPLPSVYCLLMVVLEVVEMLFVLLSLMMIPLWALLLRALGQHGFQNSNRSWMTNCPRMSGYYHNAGHHSVYLPCNNHCTDNHLHNGNGHTRDRTGNSGDSDYNHTSMGHSDTTREYYYMRTRVVGSMNHSTEGMDDQTYLVPIHMFPGPC